MTPCSGSISSRSACSLAGNIAAFLSALGRGGLQFMLIIWLQGIWLPLHGYSFAITPLWAGIYMTPLLIGFIVMGPISGYLSDRFGARFFSTAGMLLQCVGFIGLTFLPANFSYAIFAVLIFVLGCGSGLFTSPNTSSVMSSVPPETRGVSSGMRATFQNGATLVSIGLFFTLSRWAWRLPCRRRSTPDSPSTACRPRRQARSPTCRRPRRCSAPSWVITRSASCCRPSFCRHSRAPTRGISWARPTSHS